MDDQTGPVLLTYRQSAKVAAYLGEATAADPEFEVTADDGVVHTLWVIRDGALTERLTAAFDAMEALYIADGHHRSAAAARVAATRQAQNPGHTGEESYNYFLSVLFPRGDEHHGTQAHRRRRSNVVLLELPSYNFV